MYETVGRLGADRGLKYEEEQRHQQLAPLSWGENLANFCAAPSDGELNPRLSREFHINPQNRRNFESSSNSDRFPPPWKTIFAEARPRNDRARSLILFPRGGRCFFYLSGLIEFLLKEEETKFIGNETSSRCVASGWINANNNNNARCFIPLRAFEKMVNDWLTIDNSRCPKGGEGGG